MISENISFVRSRIESITGGRGIDPSGIKIVAVSKTVEAGSISEAIKFGITEVGESRIQEAVPKIAAIGSACKWHLIGHLQTNKVRKAVELFDLIQSLDSLRLAGSINTQAAELGKVQDCLIEIKVSSEESKFGIKPEDAEKFLESLGGFNNIRIKGLMAIAPFFEDKQKVRPYFRLMKDLYEKLSRKSNAKNTAFECLSMGMSSDYEIAVEEGSNMVRIGSAIFGVRGQ